MTTDGTGTGTFSLTLPQGLYTATATNSSGTTSGFSAAVGCTGAAGHDDGCDVVIEPVECRPASYLHGGGDRIGILRDAHGDCDLHDRRSAQTPDTGSPRRGPMSAVQHGDPRGRAAHLQRGV